MKCMGRFHGATHWETNSVCPGNSNSKIRSLFCTIERPLCHCGAPNRYLYMISEESYLFQSQNLFALLCGSFFLNAANRSRHLTNSEHFARPTVSPRRSTKWKTQMPSHGQENHLRFKWLPLEQTGNRRCEEHRPSLSGYPLRFQTAPTRE
jgi:hypothetical protein